MLSFNSLLNWWAEANKLMSKEKQVGQATTETAPGRADESRRITIAEARRLAFEASDKAQQARIAFAEEEAKRSYDYMVEE